MEHYCLSSWHISRLFLFRFHRRKWHSVSVVFTFSSSTHLPTSLYLYLYLSIITVDVPFRITFYVLSRHTFHEIPEIRASKARRNIDIYTNHCYLFPNLLLANDIGYFNIRIWTRRKNWFHAANTETVPRQNWGIERTEYTLSSLKGPICLKTIFQQLISTPNKIINADKG